MPRSKKGAASSTSESSNEQTHQRIPAINYLPQIKEFKLRNSTPLTLLDAVGWLLYRLFFIFILLAKVTTFLRKNNEQQAEPPGPEGHALLGVYPEFAERGILDFSDQVWKSYGQQTGICQFYLGSRHTYLVTDPEYTKKILLDTEIFARGSSFATIRHFLGNTSVTMEGEVWKQKSRELFPHLNPKKLKGYHEQITEIGRIACERWHLQAQQGKTVDLLDEMSLVTVDVIGRSLLNMDLHNEMASTGNALNKILSYIIENFVTAVPPWVLEKLPTKSNHDYKQGLLTLKTELSQAIAKYIAENRGTGEYYIDERIEAYREELDKGIVSKSLLDEIMVVFFAGHDTTSKLLTWTLFELTQNPTVSKKLYAEIDTVLQGRQPTLEDLKDLPYLGKVLQESLRVYPPVSGIVRDVTQDTQLGPYHLKKGSSVQIGMRLMGKDPKIWENPEEFNPDRFESELTNKFTQYDFTPFIAGKHRCPGQHLALMEAKTILVLLIQQFNFQLTNQEPIHAVTRVTLHPDKPINLALEVRQPISLGKNSKQEKIIHSDDEHDVTPSPQLGDQSHAIHNNAEDLQAKKGNVKDITLSDYPNITFLGQSTSRPQPVINTLDEEQASKEKNQYKFGKTN